MEITITKHFKEVFPNFIGYVVIAEVENTPHSESLWKEIEEESEWVKQNFDYESLKQRSSIAATRTAYKLFGKDPSRYRPSGEALCRRILQNKDLYRIDTLVDLINLASIRYGYSIGGFDGDKIEGDVALGVGEKGEPYEGIGRGMINIEGLPVYRDQKGGIGTPTSDNERTKMGLDTHRLVAFVNGYDGKEESTKECANYIIQLTKQYANGKNIKLYPMQ